MSYTDYPEFQPSVDMANRMSSLAEDYGRAKMAERELKEMRKVVWLLLKQIGEPVLIDRTSLLQVPEDAEILEMFQSNEYGCVTLQAK